MLLAAMLSMNLGSCNKDNDSSTSSSVTDYSVYSSATTLVSAFALKANTKVLNNLDSVKFAIDQERGLIYNADSLPKGTNVSALLVDVTCATTVASRQFIMKNGTRLNDTTLTYTGSTTDSIDFTGDVTLRITSRDGNHTRDYKVSVNVHKEDPDTIMWNMSQRRDLPNISGTIAASKTVLQDGLFLCLTLDNANYILSTSDDPAAGTWSKTTLTLPFEPMVPSFTASNNALYLLDTSNNLYTSTDNGVSWSDCGVRWHTIIGAYGNRILGVMQEDGEWKHDEYPRDDDFEPTVTASTFPVEGMSQLVMASNGWSSNQQVMMAGGMLADGSFSNTVWGYDGNRWGLLSTTGSGNALPKLRDATMFCYYTYITSSVTFTPKKYETWMVVGGILEGGSLNTVTYTSRNQGINWSEGVSSVQLPDYMPAFYGAQAFSFIRTITKNGVLRAYNPGYTTDVTEWDCPFIYLFGGYNANGQALISIWEGVLTRMTYKPVF